MMAQKGMFMRSPVGELIGPKGSMGLDNGPDMLTEHERASVKADCKCKESAGLDARNLDARNLDEPCTNGFRVLTRDADGKPTAAEPCGTPAANSPANGGQLTPAQVQQLGQLIGATVNTFGQILSPPAAPMPPPPETIIPGVPNFVTLGAAALVVVIVLWRVTKG